MMIKRNEPPFNNSDIKPFTSKVVYFSHPAFCFRTKTESICINILGELDAKEIINPADFGLKNDLKERIARSDVVIGMAVSGKLTYLVWKEMELGKKTGADVCTFFVESKNDIGPLVEDIPDEVEKLSLEESKKFSNSFLSGDLRESIFSMFVGNLSRRF